MEMYFAIVLHFFLEEKLLAFPQENIENPVGKIPDETRKKSRSYNILNNSQFK